MIASIMKIATFLSVISQQRRAGLQAPGMGTLWSSVEQSLSIIMTCIPTMGSVMRTRVWNTGVAIFTTVRRRTRVKAFGLTDHQRSNYEEIGLENRIPRTGFTGADGAGGYYGVTATCYKDNSDPDINLGENIRRTDHVAPPVEQEVTPAPPEEETAPQPPIEEAVEQVPEPEPEPIPEQSNPKTQPPSSYTIGQKVENDLLAEVVASVGACENGFAFVKVEGGYRCNGGRGAHFASDAEVEEEYRNRGGK
ncbi:hypothetical protein DL767_011139 [Monosporascus sp. MG133]|nr:hypothetical protein DL767_011139 [Monosporascus sp. MG133]